MDWFSYTEELAALMPVNIADPGFNAILPQCIEYAESRIYRDLDLLATRVRDGTQALTGNSRDFTLPQAFGRFYVVEEMNVITPVGTVPSSGHRNPLLATTKEFIDSAWPDDTPATSPSVPTVMAPITDQLWIVGPPPDAGYRVEVVGTVRPTPLSEGNSQTPLTILMPEIFVCASMVFMSGKMHDFSPAGDDPQMAVNWEKQYQTMTQGALVEELRKKYQAMGWTSRLPSPIATPPQR